MITASRDMSRRCRGMRITEESKKTIEQYATDEGERKMKQGADEMVL